jgi:SAM-dependent methyltransferase
MPDKLAPEADDAAILAECIERLQISITADAENRKNALDDLSFLQGEGQWDARVKRQREMDGRPCLTINKLPTTLHQVTNTQRQNVPGIKVHPVGSGGDIKVAEVIQGGIRHIEYKSKASVAYDTAVNGAAATGIGFFRLVTQYCRPDSFDQEIAFKRIRNAFTVYMDPAVTEVDGSDQQWCIISAKMPRSEFKLAYPNADECSFGTVRGLGDRGAEWITENEVRVAEYYRVYKKPGTVVLLSNGESGWKDELLAVPPGVTIIRERESLKSTVQWFKLSAVEVLERADIPCKWIPVFPVIGDEIDIDGRVFRSGVVRNAKDPARMYNYWMSSATEQVGLIPKAPYIGAEGQFEGHEEKWGLANVRSYPYMEYKPKSLGGQLAPPPQRQHMPDVPVGVLTMAAHASDDIKATTGIFDASLGARSNETSGVAISRRDKQGETSSYHYTDNLNTTLVHAGRCIIDMWPKIYDSERTLAIMGSDGKMSSVEINKPVMEQDELGGAVERIQNDMSVGDYGVTVSSGPSYDTLRQEAVDGMIQTAQSWPKLMDIAGDKVVRSMDWPMADEIADRIEKTIPPELRKGEDGAEEEAGANMVDTPRGPMPKDQVGPMLAQMDQQMQQMGQQLQEASSGLEKARISADASVRVAEINATNRQDVAELQGMIQMLLQKMQPPPALAVEVAQDLNSGNT